MSAIGALRRLEQGKNKGPNKEGFKSIIATLPTRIYESKSVQKSIDFAKKSWKTCARWTWIISTSLLITLVPLSIELLREEQTNEVVKELTAKGFTPMQIQGMGYHISAPESTLSAPSEAQQ